MEYLRQCAQDEATSNKFVELYHIMHTKLMETVRTARRGEAVNAHMEAHVAELQGEGHSMDEISEDEWYQAMEMMLADHEQNKCEVESWQGWWNWCYINNRNTAQLKHGGIRTRRNRDTAQPGHGETRTRRNRDTAQ